MRTAAVLLAVASLLAAGCSAENSMAENGAVVALPAATPKALSGYYHQKLSWHPCAAPGFECATMKAPLDYDKPGSGDVGLAVARKKATGPGKRIGSLLVNPGGPGGSAIGYLQAYAAVGYPAQVRARYDMVAVDPRGVDHSEPVTCLDGRQMDAYTQTDTTPDDQRERDRLVAAYKTFAAACAQHSAKILGHVSTVEAARDMDVLRAALGDRKLTYVGASYGTFLGATYAGLYPQRVGRLVLDGAMDPSLSARRMNLGQTAGFETAFRAFAQDCAKRSDCPLTAAADHPDTGGDTSTSISTDDRTAPGRSAEEVGKRLKAFFRQLDRAPIPVRSDDPKHPDGTGSHGNAAPTRTGPVRTGPVRMGPGLIGPGLMGPARTGPGRMTPTRATDAAPQPEPAARGAAPRRLGESLATTGVIAAMYDEAAWPELRQALTMAISHQDGSGLLALSDSYYEREGDGRYANLMSANAAVNCLDLPPAFTTPQQVTQALPAFEKASPVFGDGLAWASLSCAYWRVHATGHPHRIEAKGAAPIVVVGTVRDPATPYTWARALAAQLDSGRLLTYDGDGHTAYGRGSSCIDSTINHYLLTGTPPSNGKRCS
ncbi:alpha/beta hydrolase [Streptomyces odontomachi]|uniref:alpha/beta hydrolase n=1 Tax=Streptomyces odontomachi TaxID=2944940 RepID=UPI00210DB010|nr:alpha/beta hydrolase [Streptomyces sp. ODS25]